ncbi:hypothetical protein ABIB56_002531 [Glaciihabitans sp. UYNi722]
MCAPTHRCHPQCTGAVARTHPTMAGSSSAATRPPPRTAEPGTRCVLVVSLSSSPNVASGRMQTPADVRTGSACGAANVTSPDEACCLSALFAARRSARRSFRGGDIGLKPANDGPEYPGREKPRSQWTRGILAEQWQAGECRPGFGTHVLKLPADLIVDRVGSLRRRQGSGFRGVSSRTKGVGSHVGNARGLCGGPRGRHRSRVGHAARGPTGDEPPANLSSGTQLATTERSGSSNCVSWAIIFRILRFEQAQGSIGAVRSPHRDNATIRFAQSLCRNHTLTISRGGRTECDAGPARADRAHRVFQLVKRGTRCRTKEVRGAEQNGRGGHGVEFLLTADLSSLNTLRCYLLSRFNRRRVDLLVFTSPTLLWRGS